MRAINLEMSLKRFKFQEHSQRTQGLWITRCTRGRHSEIARNTSFIGAGEPSIKCLNILLQ